MCAMRYGRFLVLLFLLALPAQTIADHSVNINTADKAALMTLTGIGDVKAQAIIDYRAANPFDTKEEIMDVSGIGTATYNNIKDHITVGAQSGTQTQTETQTTATTSVQAQTVSPAPATPVSSYVPPPDPAVFADAGADRTVIVGADAEFRGRAYNKAKETLSAVRLNWNFGDGTTKEGATVLHHYDYPGSYAVVLTVSQHMESVSDRIIVKAEPAKLGFFVESDGSVVIENKAGRDLDLSRWAVSAFNRDFVLPADSVILTGASMRISPQTLGFFAGLESTLEYPNGTLALSANQASRAQTPPPAAVPLTSTAASAPAQKPTSGEQQEAVSVEQETESEQSSPIELNIAEAAAASGGVSQKSYWWLGALALAGITGAAAVAFRRLKAKEWDIVEDKG